MPDTPDTPGMRVAALEAELASLRAEMQDFTYTVSHDLRASLRHILSYAQLVQEDAAPLLPAETLGFVNTISDSARHMGVLMDGLMELSRLGTTPVAIAPLPLQALVQDVVTELRQKHPEAPIVWQVQEALPVVLADAVLLRAAVMAVLDNAVKFTAHKEQRHIGVSAQQTHAVGPVTLRIQDNGAGFNPALQSKLFKPFSRLHTVKQFAGIGMGLALTRKMLARMGGGIQAEGIVDGGCTVCITLPYCG
ncbi:two-component sensor histidine kinase [Rhodoferax lacus]|uniref:histidine kinase n=1 Tax=Rhodoferax lacus TaxID=2184758 RepID=A0A3E1RB22_9BURK|nr:ATP-binding protein [Rhodoferax lacus]RFO96252.1 two-component sensor histidine kinase [Rhodoferax lacus]